MGPASLKSQVQKKNWNWDLKRGSSLYDELVGQAWMKQTPNGIVRIVENMIGKSFEKFGIASHPRMVYCSIIKTQFHALIKFTTIQAPVEFTYIQRKWIHKTQMTWKTWPCDSWRRKKGLFCRFEMILGDIRTRLQLRHRGISRGFGRLG